MPPAPISSRSAAIEQAVARPAATGSGEVSKAASALWGSKTSPAGLELDGRYVIEQQIGEGGMGYVFAGRHKLIDKRIAIKLLRADLVQDDEITQRFLNEAQAASRIGSPHIIDVVDFGTAPNGAAYFVMEFLDGQSLAKLIAKERVLPLRRLLHVARQIASGLAAAHQAGIIHRDLKPDNVMLIAREADADFVKVLDFGVAKIGNAHSKLTRAGSVFGTPQYMSPEQASGVPVDPTTDVYSLGILLYEMSVGSVPFDDENMMNVLSAHMFREPPAVRDVSPQVLPAEFEAIVRRCLHKEPSMRFPSMQALGEELERFAASLPDGVYDQVIADPTKSFQDSGVSPRAVSATVPNLPKVPVASRVKLFAASAAAATLFAVLGTVFYLRASPTDEAGMSAEIPAELSAAPAEAPSRSVALSVAPPGATVRFGDRVLEVSADGLAKLMLARGQSATVQIARDGFVAQTLQIPADFTGTTAVVLEPLPPVAEESSQDARPRGRGVRPVVGKGAGKPPAPATTQSASGSKKWREVDPFQ